MTGPAGVVVPPATGHPSDYVIRDLVSALRARGATPIGAPRAVGRLLAKVRAPLRARPRRPLLVPVMGGPSFPLLYAAALRGTPVPYAWDVWEPEWPLWIAKLEPLRLPLLFVTSRQAAEHLGERLSGTRVVWMPEATDVGNYDPGPPLSERAIDVLELGRRHAPWHEAVTGPAAEGGLSHEYVARPGEIIFPTEAEMRAGLAASRISVCFPASLTTPSRAGSVVTLTHRYLESIASRCLILGQAPSELVDLFGFDPVIEVDEEDPWGQLQRLLADIDSYQELVDRAHRRLPEVASWDVRVERMLELVAEELDS